MWRVAFFFLGGEEVEWVGGMQDFGGHPPMEIFCLRQKFNYQNLSLNIPLSPWNFGGKKGCGVSLSKSPKIFFFFKDFLSKKLFRAPRRRKKGWYLCQLKITRWIVKLCRRSNVFVKNNIVPCYNIKCSHPRFCPPPKKKKKKSLSPHTPEKKSMCVCVGGGGAEKVK